MTKFNIFKAAVIFMLALVLRPVTEGQGVPMVPVTPFAPRPLCNFQMALANQACAYLPFIQVPPPAPRAPLAPPPPPIDDDEDHEHRHHRRERDEDPDRDDHDHDDDHGHDGDDDDHDHDRDHDGDRDGDHDHEHEHHRRQHHHHSRHHRRHHDTPVEQQCCKWLSQVDDQCVCELLVHLPPFLARPVHKLSIIVGRACNITYTCGSRLRT